MFIQGHRLPNNKRKDSANLFPFIKWEKPRQRGWGNDVISVW